MAQIINEPTAGARLGTALGTGLGAGLQQLAALKAQQLQQRQLANAYQAAGLQPELAYLPQEIVKSYLERGGGAFSLPGQQQTQQQTPFEQLMQPQEQQQEETPQIQEQLQEPRQVAKQLAREFRQELTPQQALQTTLKGGSLAGSPMVRQMVANALENLQFPAAEKKVSKNVIPTEPAKIIQQPAQIPQKPTLGQILAQPTAKEQRIIDYQNKKLALQEKQLEQTQKKEAFKETKELRKDILEKAKAAKQNLHDLERLEELEKEGKLNTAGYVEFLKRSGLDIPALLNEGSEEYNKVTQTFLRDAKTYLGSRISNFELEQFLKTIPSLSQSPAGRNRVISNLKYIQRSALAYTEALKDILSENKGIPPLDLGEQIDDRVGKKLDKISQKFKQDLAKPVPQGQNKYITALQATLGTAVGRLPKAAVGAGTGALAGYKVAGPYGAVGGGILGGLAGLGGLGVKDLL